MKASIRSNGLALAGFAAVCTLLVSLVNYFTKDTIAEQKQQLLMQQLNLLLPAGSYNNPLDTDCILVSDQPLLGSDKPQQLYRARLDQQPVAAVIQTTAPNGYSGSIQLMMAVDLQGNISGVRVLSHKETPGLGDKIDERKSDWILSFNNQQVKGEDDKRWAVKKDDGMFDQFTGATITPRAVVQAVKNTALYFKANQQELFAAPANCADTVPNTQAPAPNNATGNATGNTGGQS